MSFAYISTIKLMAFVARGVTYEALIATSAAKWSAEEEARLPFATQSCWRLIELCMDVATFHVTDVLPATMAFAYISTIRMTAWHCSGHT